LIYIYSFHGVSDAASARWPKMP